MIKIALCKSVGSKIHILKYEKHRDLKFVPNIEQIWFLTLDKTQVCSSTMELKKTLNWDDQNWVCHGFH